MIVASAAPDNMAWLTCLVLSICGFVSLSYGLYVLMKKSSDSPQEPPSEPISVMCTYQQWVKNSAIYPPGLNYPLGTLTSEAGECQGAVIKFIRRTHLLEAKFRDMPDDLKKHFVEELSDVVWAIAALLNECEMTFEQLAGINRDKLEKREAAGGLYSSAP